MGEHLRGVAVVRPGDRLLFLAPTGTTPDEMFRMRDGMRERFPHNEVTVVACDGVAIVTDAEPSPFPKLRLWSLFSRKGAQR